MDTLSKESIGQFKKDMSKSMEQIKKNNAAIDAVPKIAENLENLTLLLKAPMLAFACTLPDEQKSLYLAELNKQGV